MEIELGPVEYLRDGADRTLLAPDARINYGFTPGWEASLEGDVAHGVTAGVPGTSLIEAETLLKGVLREGSCRRSPGPISCLASSPRLCMECTNAGQMVDRRRVVAANASPGASADALRVLAARGVRAFADGFVALLLPIYLVELGFSALAISAIVTSTLIGTAILTLGVGWIANRYSRRLLLLAAAILMTATGAGFAMITDFWPLLVIAFVGTMNPTSGDASIFVPPRTDGAHPDDRGTPDKAKARAAIAPKSRCRMFSVTTAAAILFWSSLCSAFSYLVAVPIAARIGLINTMVFTHLPSNILLILIPFAPDLAAAIGLLLARSALSQMDVPTRTSYVMAVVTPAERPAAASITAVPKTFAWAAGSMISGYLLTLSTFGWPLLIAGAIKGAYDILLLIKFQKVRPPEEARAAGN
jgi:MFS family permease